MSKVEINATPILSEMFKTQAMIKTLASFLLTEEQQNDFKKVYLNNLGLVISQYLEDFPDSVKDANILKDTISEITNQKI